MSQGKELTFGRFLNDDERRDFADALRAALLDARGGVKNLRNGAQETGRIAHVRTH